MYCPNLNFSSCEIFASVISIFSIKKERIRYISLLLTHLSMYLKFMALSFCCLSSCSFRYFWKSLLRYLND